MYKKNMNFNIPYFSKLIISFKRIIISPYIYTNPAIYKQFFLPFLCMDGSYICLSLVQIYTVKYLSNTSNIKIMFSKKAI